MFLRRFRRRFRRRGMLGEPPWYCLAAMLQSALLFKRSIHRTFEIDEAGIRRRILERQYLRTPKTADAVYVTDPCGWNVGLRFARRRALFASQPLMA